MPTWFNATITNVTQLTEDTRQFDLVIPEMERFDFQPGQFVTIDLPIGVKRRERWRSYSIVSAPEGTNHFSLCIVRSPEGAGTRYLFEEIGPGSILTCKGPDGAFVLPRLTEREVVMVCTGTGIAPFRSMLRFLDHTALPFSHIHLIAGTRFQKDILYRTEWDALQQKYPHFHWDVALSREEVPGFHHGYVHDIYEKEYAYPIPDRHFYLCGWANMIDEAVARLKKTGYDSSQIHFELYG
jgi:CDP-4-dehydro-6-deoxyglucose reductase